MYKNNFKRLFDIILSVSLFFLLLPLMIMIYFLVWINIGYPIFKQRRPGLNRKLFTIYKFKTLYDSFQGTPIYKRQNKLGNFLRKTGLDELPQLLNVINNSMSLVGPRPLLLEYLKKYSHYEKMRHLVKPGITGLAQVDPCPQGKKSWKKSIKLDIYYVKNITFKLDFVILLKTIKLIITGQKQYNDFKKSL